MAGRKRLENTPISLLKHVQGAFWGRLGAISGRFLGDSGLVLAQISQKKAQKIPFGGRFLRCLYPKSDFRSPRRRASRVTVERLMPVSSAT